MCNEKSKTGYSPNFTFRLSPLFALCACFPWHPTFAPTHSPHQVESLQFPSPLVSAATSEAATNINSTSTNAATAILVPGAPVESTADGAAAEKSGAEKSGAEKSGVPPKAPSRAASTDVAAAAAVTQLQQRWQSLAEQWQEKVREAAFVCVKFLIHSLCRNEASISFTNPTSFIRLLL